MYIKIDNYIFYINKYSKRNILDLDFQFKLVNLYFDTCLSKLNSYIYFTHILIQNKLFLWEVIKNMWFSKEDLYTLGVIILFILYLVLIYDIGFIWLSIFYNNKNKVYLCAIRS